MYEVTNEWQGIPIVHSVRVDPPVILNRMQFSVLLFNEEEGRCVRGFGGDNVPLFQLFVYKGV